LIGQKGDGTISEKKAAKKGSRPRTRMKTVRRKKKKTANFKMCGRNSVSRGKNSTYKGMTKEFLLRRRENKKYFGERTRWYDSAGELDDGRTID